MRRHSELAWLPCKCKQQSPGWEYHGVGALGLQYFLQWCLFHFIRSVIEYGNRAITMHQQQQQLPPSTSSKPANTGQFDSSLSAATVAPSFLDDPPITSARFAPLYSMTARTVKEAPYTICFDVNSELRRQIAQTTFIISNDGQPAHSLLAKCGHAGHC
ncbi:unnamed protein product [Gongylonema pulchrum]|uniref:Uncharacterized protein n=1 Tax=Gongylonema pulchrum TaxID=637853 RepID=A0A183EIJ2_9BILA|nr:unnamed protein product [Gongylonema pulchrum]